MYPLKPCIKFELSVIRLTIPQISNPKSNAIITISTNIATFFLSIFVLSAIFLIAGSISSEIIKPIKHQQQNNALLGLDMITGNY